MPWKVRLALQVETDLQDILKWTKKQFGEKQANTYLQTITLAAQALKDGPDIPGVQRLSGIDSDARTLHVGRQGRKGRHFLVFRLGPQKTIDVLRLLHERMDLKRHVS